MDMDLRWYVPRLLTSHHCNAELPLQRTVDRTYVLVAETQMDWRMWTKKIEQTVNHPLTSLATDLIVRRSFNNEPQGALAS